MQMLDYVKLANPRLRENLARLGELTEPLCRVYRAHAPQAIRFVACGSSRHACLAARDYLQRALGLPVLVATPEAYIAYDHAQPAGALDLFVTQSGYSTNTLAALDFARQLGRPAIALTGNPASPVAEHAEQVIDWGVGVESVDFVTMGVHTLVLFLLGFGLRAGERAATLSAAQAQADRASLAGLPEAHAAALQASEAFVAAHRLELACHAPALVVGNGPQHAVALEACLKLNECLKRSSAAHEAEEFVHGPEMQVTPSYQLFFIDDPQGSPRIRSLAMAFAELCRATYLVTAFSSGWEHELVLPAPSQPLFGAIPALVPFQYLAAQLMDELRCEPVHPYQDRIESRLAAKANGYGQSIQALEAQAATLYAG